MRHKQYRKNEEEHDGMKNRKRGVLPLYTSGRENVGERSGRMNTHTYILNHSYRSPLDI
jgi:hypothetical protein